LQKRIKLTVKSPFFAKLLGSLKSRLFIYRYEAHMIIHEKNLGIIRDKGIISPETRKVFT